MIGDSISDRPTIYLEDNIIEEVEYLTDYNESSSNCNDDEEQEESDWDSSTLSVLAYTPQRKELGDGVYPGVSPVSLALSPSRLSEPSARGTTYGLLASFHSPPEAKPRRPQFENFGVDNRTRNPHYIEYDLSPTSEEDNGAEVYLDEKEIDESIERKERASAMSYGASKYLARPSLSMTQQSMYDRRLRMSLESPGYNSTASIQTTSTRNSRRYSMMSHRSSTSMSMLFGEVINLEDRSRFGNSQAAQSPLPPSLYDIDLENGLEGIEIGGGTRPVQGLLRNAAIQSWIAAIPLDTTVDVVARCFHQAKLLGHTATRSLHAVASKTRLSTQRVIHSYRPPLSPHARALEDFDYLQQAHKEKVGQLTENSDLEEHFDFVLLLKPQEVYRFWADILDFRVEHLGDEFMGGLEPMMEAASTNSTETKDSDDDDVSKEFEPLRQSHLYATPITGMRRRAVTPVSSDRSPLSPLTRLHQSISRHSVSNHFFSPTNPSNQSFTSGKRLKQRLSMFEKAVNVLSSPVAPTVDESSLGLETPMQDTRSVPSTLQRRRWGNRAIGTQSTSTANILSPPVRSLTRGVNSVRKVRVNKIPHGEQGEDSHDDKDAENVNPNRVKVAEEYPNPVIPRGIAARTNGMLPFLSALKRGIVVRRHRANKDALFCKIFSKDGGDTIQYQLIDTEEAVVAFKEQRVRHNRHLMHGCNPDSMRALTQDWARTDGAEGGTLIHKFNVPDHVAAHRYREKLSRELGLKKQILDLATKAANSGIIRAADLVAVHPASHPDPRHPGVRQGALGTSTLRKSKSAYYTPHTFSIVVNTAQRLGQKNKKQKVVRREPLENRWCNGDGNDLQFKILDFEVATEGEYWLLFRGFLLLHRDVVVGRFAADRRAGIGGGNRNNRNPENSDVEETNDELENLLHRDEFLEPITVGAIERIIVSVRKLDKTYMEGEVALNAVPPPSDYFLGFKSPGTQVSFRKEIFGVHM